MSEETKKAIQDLLKAMANKSDVTIIFPDGVVKFIREEVTDKKSPYYTGERKSHLVLS